MPTADPRPTLALIAALDRRRLIGVDSLRMPWHLPADLRHFRALTLGKPVVMGRRTHQSIGRPLPGRLNVVLTRRGDLAPQPGVLLPAADLATARSLAEEWLMSSAQAGTSAPEVMVIGGAEIYAQTIADADRLYLTEIDAEFDGNNHFPAFRDMQPGWREVVRNEQQDPESGLRYAFVVYERDRPRQEQTTTGDEA